MTSQLIFPACVYVVAFKLVYSVQFEWKISISLCTGLNILSVYKTKVRYEN